MVRNGIPVITKTILIIAFILICNDSSGQQLPVNPTSLRIYNPFIINPAIAGSKDYLSVDLLAGFQGKSYSRF